MYNLIAYLHPNRLIEKSKSKFNGIIEIRTEFGKPRVIVNNTPQSGGIVTSILKKALDEFVSPKNFLLLGIGGGDILHQIHKRWPDCHIIAIEIDPEMIKIAQTYFKLNQIPKLKIINQDAFNFIQLKTKFDAILVDCYIGDQIPPKLESVEFLQNLKRQLTLSGAIAFNRLNTKKHQLSNMQFIQNLKTFFLQTYCKTAYCNLLIVAKNA